MKSFLEDYLKRQQKFGISTPIQAVKNVLKWPKEEKSMEDKVDKFFDDLLLITVDARRTLCTRR